MAGESQQVFISYARGDAERVSVLVEGLRRLHRDVWLDEELTGGQLWWDAVLSQIRASSAILVAVSPAALESVAVRREYEYGHAVGRPLLPVVVDTVRLETLPSLLAALQVVDYCQPDVNNALDLAAALVNLPAPQALPQPLPDPPPIPISYLSELKERSQADTLSKDDQLALIGLLKEALGRPSEREAAEEMLRLLQNRNDLYQVSAREIESLLSSFDQVPAPYPQDAVNARLRASAPRERTSWSQYQILDLASADVRPKENTPSRVAKKEPRPILKDPTRATRVLSDAVRTAHSIADKSSRAQALASIAAAMTVTDRDRAARLGADAERIARSITNKSSKASALASIAAALAAADPDRAVRIARSITDESSKAQALASIAAALTVTDPFLHLRHASIPFRYPLSASNLYRSSSLRDVAKLRDDAVRIARSITDEFSKTRALASITAALAATDPDRAERIARSITNKSSKASALASIAAALAVADPDRAARLGADAERIARSITDESSKASALASITAALAAADLNRAERIARDITDESSKTRALASITAALAATDPDRAERIARDITDESSKARALASITAALAATDPDRAERIARDITDELWQIQAMVAIANASSRLVLPYSPGSKDGL